MTTSATGVAVLPYRRQGDIDYSSLEFDPDGGDRPPDHMEQSIPIQEILWLIHAWLEDFYRRPDVFIDNGNFICYDPSNLNVRVAPDVYISLGVDAEAIRSRRLYLPWEVGKPPDWVLEVASESTGNVDTGRKRRIYAEIGIPEFWRFDPDGWRLPRPGPGGGATGRWNLPADRADYRPGRDTERSFRGAWDQSMLGRWQAPVLRSSYGRVSTQRDRGAHSAGAE